MSNYNPKSLFTLHVGAFHLIIFLTFFGYDQMECNSNFLVICNHSIVKLASLGNAIL